MSALLKYGRSHAGGVTPHHVMGCHTCVCVSPASTFMLTSNFRYLQKLYLHFTSCNSQRPADVTDIIRRTCIYQRSHPLSTACKCQPLENIYILFSIINGFRLSAGPMHPQATTPLTLRMKITQRRRVRRCASNEGTLIKRTHKIWPTWVRNR